MSSLTAITRKIPVHKTDTHRHTRYFPTGAEEDQVAALFLPPSSSCPSRLSLSQINASESGFRNISDVLVYVCEGVRRKEGGVANNQARYTNLRWQHLVYLKLEGQLY